MTAPPRPTAAMEKKAREIVNSTPTDWAVDAVVTATGEVCAMGAVCAGEVCAMGAVCAGAVCAMGAVCAGADVFEAVSNEWYGPTSGDRLSEFLRARFGTAVKALEQIARTDYGHPDIGLMPLRKLAQDALASLCGEREAPHD